MKNLKKIELNMFENQMWLRLGNHVKKSYNHRAPAVIIKQNSYIHL